jgi:ATP-binding protein involved in chromosome partitioning
MNFLKKILKPKLPDGIEKQLLAAINSIRLDDISNNIITIKNIQDASFKNALLSFKLQLSFPAKSLWQTLEHQLSEKLLEHTDIEQVKINISTKIDARMSQNNSEGILGVKNIIAIASGKGGVGKSTSCVNIALALKKEGAKVGILDADIYGPSIPTMLGTNKKPETLNGKSMEPIDALGLQLMSIGFLIDPEEPMVWRGPMVTQTLTQLLRETNWHDLDYLLIDLPPGTGDVQLTLSQQIPVTGALIVTTPQEIALIDARKGLKMFEKVNIPILGIIENMSTHVCTNCGHEEAIFGENGGLLLAKESKTPLLAQLPLNQQLRISMDTGNPIVYADPTSELANKYIKIAHKIGSILTTQRKNYTRSFPKISIENT